MNKILFNVLLPATFQTFDFWVPGDMLMCTVSELIAKAMSVYKPDFYTYNPDAVLMYIPTGEIQDPTKTVNDIGFTDGDRFVLL